MKRPANNAAGAHRPPPPYPPIDPALVYPWRRLGDWGFGARGVAALQKAGLPALRFGRQKFFLGSGLISVLRRAAERQAGDQGRGGDGDA